MAKANIAARRLSQQKPLRLACAAQGSFHRLHIQDIPNPAVTSLQRCHLYWYCKLAFLINWERNAPLTSVIEWQSWPIRWPILVINLWSLLSAKEPAELGRTMNPGSSLTHNPRHHASKTGQSRSAVLSNRHELYVNEALVVPVTTRKRRTRVRTFARGT